MQAGKYEGMRVPELRKALEGRGLKKSGNKPELIQVTNFTPLLPMGLCSSDERRGFASRTAAAGE